jgi:hypothetical protein
MDRKRGNEKQCFRALIKVDEGAVTARAGGGESRDRGRGRDQ